MMGFWESISSYWVFAKSIMKTTGSTSLTWASEGRPNGRSLALGWLYPPHQALQSPVYNWKHRIKYGISCQWLWMYYKLATFLKFKSAVFEKLTLQLILPYLCQWETLHQTSDQVTPSSCRPTRALGQTGQKDISQSAMLHSVAMRNNEEIQALTWMTLDLGRFEELSQILQLHGHPKQAGTN